jgi:hypothetical protein
MGYPYTKLLRHITDIRYIPVESRDKLEIHGKDMRGNKEVHDVLEFSACDLYSLISEVYDLGQQNARQKIKDALEGRY